MGQQKEREVYMKKKLVVVILVIICIAGIVFAGFYRRKHKDVM